MNWMVSLVSMVLLGGAGHAAVAGDSLLRISCEGADTGAEININGKFRGECPLDIKVKPGVQKVRVHKPVNRLRERVFEIDVRMGEDTVKKIEVLFEERNTVAGQAEEDQRVRAVQVESERKEAARQAGLTAERQRAADAEAERLRIERAPFLKLISDAEAGDVDAQMSLAERYQAGKGLSMDAAKATQLYKQAAASGNELAKFLVNKISISSPPEDIDAVKKMLRLPRVGQRIVGVLGHENVTAMADSDPFFAMPPGGYGVTAAYPVRPEGVTTSLHCQRSGNLATLKGASTTRAASVRLDFRALLGGLLLLDSKEGSGGVNLEQGKLSAVDGVYGIPFPLIEDRRFGMQYRYVGTAADDGAAPTAATLDCNVTSVRIGSGDRAPAASLELICLADNARSQSISRWVFHDDSGCFLGIRQQGR